MNRQSSVRVTLRQQRCGPAASHWRAVSHVVFESFRAGDCGTRTCLAGARLIYSSIPIHIYPFLHLTAAAVKRGPWARPCPAPNGNGSRSSSCHSAPVFVCTDERIWARALSGPGILACTLVWLHGSLSFPPIPEKYLHAPAAASTSKALITSGGAWTSSSSTPSPLSGCMSLPLG